jgi:glucose-1-phosphate cytidylyltransferase
MISSLILAGGLGTRLREETEFKPKPMVEIGGKPIVWHIMKNLSVQGFSEFTIATGYKGELIIDYFLNYHSRNNDVTVDLGKNSAVIHHGLHDESQWKVTVANTGEMTMTGGRVFRSLKYLQGERFLCTYGDGLADVDVKELLSFHLSHGKKATVTTVQPLSRFGVMDVNDDGVVNQFREKPVMDGWVNAGFFIFEKSIAEYLDTDCFLEQEPLARLAAEGELVAYRHHGFWHPMDTLRDKNYLESLWQAGKAPWKNWQ